MGVEILVAGLAFCIALIALWLTSDVLKKVESQNEKFVRSHIKVIRDEIKAVDKHLHEVARAVKAAKDGQTNFDGRLNDHTKELDILKGQSVYLRKQIEELDTSIPARYRVRATVKEEKSKVNPSIQ